jgi:hypothetical protein
LISISIGREAKRAVRQMVAETEPVGGGFAEILDTHPHFAFRRQKPVNPLGLFFCVRKLCGQPKAR